MNALVISGSIRSRKYSTDFIYECSKETSELPQYIASIENYQHSNPPISNSDILAGAVLVALKSQGANIDLFPLISLFSKREKKMKYSSTKSIDDEVSLIDTLSLDDANFLTFKKKIKSAHGIVLVSPVYFGDRSSVANKLLQLSGMHNLINEKVFGAVSVGAKRNGGQETTIIYSLFEAMNQNALIVGNGPPTSQYGGTAVGGKRGSVIKDIWGLETSWGTGVRVAHVSKILKKAKDKKLKRPVNILFLITMDDREQILSSYLDIFLKKVTKKVNNVNFVVENVLNSTIYRCLGCDNCPPNGALPSDINPSRSNHPNCIIDNSEDAMSRIHNLFLDADGIVIAGLNVKQHDQLLYRYQALTERTRYIRRDNFELTNKVIAPFSLNQVGSRINLLHSLKTVTSYIRHNTIIHKPIETFIYNGKVIDEGIEDMIHFVRTTEKISIGKSMVKPLKTVYIKNGIGGY